MPVQVLVWTEVSFAICARESTTGNGTVVRGDALQLILVIAGYHMPCQVLI